MTPGPTPAVAIPDELRLLASIEGVRWTDNGGRWVSEETVHRLAEWAIAGLENRTEPNAALEREAVTPAGETGP